MATFGPYKATVISIHDGDTATLAVQIGFDVAITRPCRFYGINAPELRTDAGKAALAFLQTRLHVGDTVTVVSHGWDKYSGRFDGLIFLADGTDVSALMLTSGNAVPYPAAS